MSQSGTHYERAFEAFLSRGGFEYVCVDQARKALFSSVSIKSFDFLVYPPRRPGMIVDVKGRKLSYPIFQRRRIGESWATAADVEGMKNWQEIFGRKYLTAFVFAYWICPENPTSLAEAIATPVEPLASMTGVFHFEQRFYSFMAVELSAYCLCMRRRSASWKTVYVPARIFRQLAQPLEQFVRYSTA